jgi:hypothetical protein
MAAFDPGPFTKGAAAKEVEEAGRLARRAAAAQMATKTSPMDVIGDVLDVAAVAAGTIAGAKTGGVKGAMKGAELGAKLGEVLPGSTKEERYAKAMAETQPTSKMEQMAQTDRAPQQQEQNPLLQLAGLVDLGMSFRNQMKKKDENK